MLSMFDFEQDGEAAVKRLPPTTATLRQLFALSGNICAFPNCDAPLILHDGTYVAQLCHIEAAEKGGERFNEEMSNEERRAPANLMLMCYTHHQVTNDVVKYPPEVLQKMKTDHERLFSGVDRLILGEVRDWDKTSSLILPFDFSKYYDFVEWPRTEQPDLEFELAVKERLQMLAQAPLAVRAFLELVCKGIVRQQDRYGKNPPNDRPIDNILVIDVQNGARMSDKRMVELLTLLRQYKLGGVHTYDSSSEHEIYVRDIRDVPFFESIVRFGKFFDIPSEVFFHDLDFSSLQNL